MSLPHTAALAAAIGPAAAAGFALSVTDYKRSLEDPRIEKLVHCEVNSQVEAATMAVAVPARVTIILTDRSKHSVFVPLPKGSPSPRPITSRALANRFTAHACDQIVERESR